MVLRGCVSPLWNYYDVWNFPAPPPYYRLADLNPVLYAAVALNPSMKFEYFEVG
jgi:hypothetical protein